MSELIGALGIVLGYVIGAIPSGLIIGKGFCGVDLRDHGSNNIGFTNALRVLGPKIGIPVLLADVLKALLAVILIPQFFVESGAESYAIIVGLAVLIGNLFNIFLGGKGGKGAATGLGVFFGLAPIPMAIALAVFLTIVFTTRYVSLSSMSASIVLPVAILLLNGANLLFWVTLVCSSFLIFKHKANIKRLLAGTESKIGSKKMTETDASSDQVS